MNGNTILFHCDYSNKVTFFSQKVNMTGNNLAYKTDHTKSEETILNKINSNMF